MDVLEQKLKAAIEGQHGGTAHLAYIDVVSETRQGRPVEGGLVFVFDLEGHSEAARAYGWTSQGGEDERRFHFCSRFRQSHRCRMRCGPSPWLTAGMSGVQE